MDREVLEWIVTALKESHGDEKRYHDEMIAKLQKEYQKLQDRIDAMYVDKLDGKVPQEFICLELQTLCIKRERPLLK
jgi:hypothetical protein